MPGTFSNLISSNQRLYPAPPSGPSAKKNRPRSCESRAGSGIGTAYFVQVVVSGIPLQLASYLDVPVLSLPSPAMSSVAAWLAFAQKVIALYPDRSRIDPVGKAPPA